MIVVIVAIIKLMRLVRQRFAGQYSLIGTVLSIPSARQVERVTWLSSNTPEETMLRVMKMMMRGVIMMTVMWQWSSY